jgi:hypothetical protein
MKVTRNSDGTFCAAGNGPIRPIAADGMTRREAIQHWSHAFAEQRIEVHNQNHDAYRYVTVDLGSPQLEENWEKRWENDRPYEVARRYAEQEAMTALAEENDMASLSPSEREYITGDLG